MILQNGTKFLVAWVILALLTAGCGDPQGPTPERVVDKPAKARNPRVVEKVATKSPQTGRSESPRRAPSPETTPSLPKLVDVPATDVPATDRPPETHRQNPPPRRRRPLAHLLDQPADSAPRWVPNLPRMQVDDARAAAAGIRKLSSKRLTLYTDLPASEEIERLPQIFDLAFPQWCEYFRIDQAKRANWSMTGFLMKDKSRFQQTGTLPGDLPPFQHGYARNYELWLYDQPSDYYRRHLLLHEGTHGFMNTILGACGPPWYMEGIAEMLGTHRFQDGRLTLNYMPASREEVLHWGRVRIIKDAFAENRAMHLANVLEYSASAHLKTEPYAWCWAAAMLLDRHPRYQTRFRQLYKDVLNPDFTDRFFRLMKADWQELSEEWQVMVAGMEYGYDVSRTVIDFTPGKAMPVSGAVVKVAADRGWQNSRLRLEGGVAYRLRASGRYQVAEEPQPWPCESGGVSIRYYRGMPLGILTAALRADKPASGNCSALLRPAVVGLGTTLTPAEDGTLYLKINDSAAELGDNAGELQVEVRRTTAQ